ncbi:Hsp20/alpha crystallin family protein [Amycolatopsis anabasis]|uniref:Hsp20/alpha crystallin family protein n=1 Tax=Amycolatopsis anabasis TaxID=1840409 RepID=UPI00131D633E|nr:Hsp20/alpha crystallin family protein [Amycolatopsis anabasis]
MNLPIRRRAHALLSDLPELFDAFQPFAGMRPLIDPHAIRLEDQLAEGRYTVRAELPGIDAEKDLEVTVHDGLLTIRAERSEDKADKNRSEFRYGSFARTVSLPAGAKEDTINAEYADGILTVTAQVGEPESPAKQIKVRAK